MSAKRIYKRPILLLVAILSIGVTAIVIISVGVVIYPGAMKWTAPMLCPADQSDAHVVRTTVSTTDGTSTSFSLLCMGDRGDFTEAGTWMPTLLLTLWTWIGLVALSVALYVRFIVRHRRRAIDGPDRPVDAPPVDAPPVDAPVDAPPDLGPSPIS